MREALYAIITTPDLDLKISSARSLAHTVAEEIPPLNAERLAFLRNPGRPERFKVVAPRDVPSRLKLSDDTQRNNFLHAIANIELLAIELPLLCLLRFGSSDLRFIKTQLGIVAEEALHFKLLRDRLRDFGCEFGSIVAHQQLWEQAWKCNSELEHQIIIPCYLEARGLDVTPQFVKNFRDLKDDLTADILQKILDDEIGHVRHGMDYLKSHEAALRLSSDEIFETTVKTFFQGRHKSKIKLNQELRVRAGFSEGQMGCLR